MVSTAIPRLDRRRAEPARKPFTDTIAHKTGFLNRYLLVSKGTTKTIRTSPAAGDAGRVS